MERLLTRLAAAGVVNVPACWFALVAVGLPLPFREQSYGVLTQGSAALLVALWTPVAALFSGWLTGRWTDGLLAAAPLPLVRLLALAWLLVLGPTPFGDRIPPGDELYGALAAIGTSLLLLLAADMFWTIVGSLVGATSLLHQPGWEPRKVALSALSAVTVATAGLLLLPALWLALDIVLKQLDLYRSGPTTLVAILWGATVLPSVGLYVGSTALARRPLTIPLAVCTGGLLAILLFGTMLDARVRVTDALLMLGVFGPLVGVVALPGVLGLGVLGTGVGRMARGERLFGSERGKEDVAQSIAT